MEVIFEWYLAVLGPFWVIFSPFWPLWDDNVLYTQWFVKGIIMCTLMVVEVSINGYRCDLLQCYYSRSDILCYFRWKHLFWMWLYCLLVSHYDHILTWTEIRWVLLSIYLWRENEWCYHRCPNRDIDERMVWLNEYQPLIDVLHRPSE